MFLRNSSIVSNLTRSTVSSKPSHYLATMQKLTFSELTQGKPSFPKEEQKIIEYWRKIKAFETQLEKTKNNKPFTFYDGPPFATGKPHYGHILAGTIKDVICRYASQTGHYVERRFGWDCHGLPVEYEIEKKLGIKTREDVMKIGIRKYNEECRGIVMRCASDWEHTVERMGRWIDFKNDYKTLDISYMESAWWVFGELHKKGLVYRDFKVMPYSTALNTPLSNFEAKSNYQKRRDPAIVVTFPIISDNKFFDNTSFLAWTTTPWTLPSNLALCINKKLTYVKFQDVATGKFYICGKKVLSKSKKENTILKGKKGFKHKVIEEIIGEKLINTKYEPLFNYFISRTHCFRVIEDNYVTEEEGTGIVHQAPGFGEDDLRACERHEIHRKGQEEVACPIDHNGRFVEPVSDYLGEYVLDANKDIIRDLKKNERLWNNAIYEHDYPFCWRSDTPLLYRAIPSWFIKVTDIKDKLIENNKQTYWVPSFVKEKRFHNWLADARDWAVSRNRYWGTPIPIWISDDELEWEVISSVEELSKRTGKTITDLHRENIDDLKIKSSTSSKILHRVDEVFDCWFESGSMPYGQCHYPFAYKNKLEEFSKRFPADFIAEGLDQTRGWFYTLLVLSTALFNKPAWKNVIVNGMVLAEDGTKMSKRKKNYPSPDLIFDTYGADALRIYLCSSPVVHGDKLKFSEHGVHEVITKVLSPWYNAYNFFIENASRFERTNSSKFKYNDSAHLLVTNIMDKWILSELQSLVLYFRAEMEGYRLYTITPRLLHFIDLLCNTYLRMNRLRIRGQISVEDADHSLQTLFTVLLTLCRLMSPLSPFIVETMYLNLRSALGDDSELSIHFMDIPLAKEDAIDLNIERRVRNLHKSIKLGRTIRDRNNLKIKLPLSELMVVHSDQQVLDDIKGLNEYILTELNIKKVTYSSEMGDYISLSGEPEYKSLGNKFKKKTGKLSKSIKKLSHSELVNLVENGSIMVDNESLTNDDIKVIWNFVGDTKKWCFNSGDEGIIILMDRRITDDLRDEGTAREICNRIQKLRKTGKLVPADKVNVFYDIIDDEKDNFERINNVFNKHTNMIQKKTRIKCLPSSYKSSSIGIICNEITDVEGIKIKLTLCILQIYLNKTSGTNLSKIKNQNELNQIEIYLQSQNIKNLKNKYKHKSNFKFEINDKEYNLIVGDDIFYDTENMPQQKEEQALIDID